MTRILAKDVLEYVAADHGMALSVLLSKRRTRDVARPRQIAMYVMREVCQHLSFPAIGRLMGGLDHTTILHGVRKVEELIAVDAEVARVVSRTVHHFRKLDAEIEEAADPDDTMARALSFYTLCARFERAMGMAS